MIKRYLTALVGTPIIVLLLLYSNKYVMDAIWGVIAIMAIYEVLKCLSKKYKPVYWLGFLACLIIPFIHVIEFETLKNVLLLLPVGLLTIMFIQVVLTKMETSYTDMAVSFSAIMYIVGLTIFAPLIFGIEDNGELLGKFYIWYLFTASWGSDAWAYIIGVKFGKHKYSKISPKKSVEGAIAGIIGGTIMMVIETAIFNNCFGLDISYLTIAGMGVLLTVLGQIGDLAASSIKRNVEVKDFSNLLPGHGGIVDRIDSVIFIAPVAFFLFTLCL